MQKFRYPLWLCLTLLVGLWACPGPADAQLNPDGKLLLHLIPVDKRPKGNVCDRHEISGPADIVTRGKLEQDYLAYVIIADFDTTEGLCGVQFGISYDGEEGSGVDVFSWQQCALYEWPMDEWWGANSGNLLTWDQAADCQHESPLVVGVFHLHAYSADRFKLTTRPVDDLVRIAACGLLQLNVEERVNDIQPENLGWLDFGEGEGYNPWDPEQNLLKIQDRFKPIKN